MYKHRYLIKFILILFFLAIVTVTFFFLYNRYEKQGIKSVFLNINGKIEPQTKGFDIPQNIEEGKRQKDIRQEFLDLREKYSNDDIVGYLKIEGTSIDYPVVQHTDNEFYLEKNIYKEPDLAGWIFLDYENNIEYFDKNSIIYGHNMKKDIMFHSLRLFKDEEFFSNHRYIIFKTLYEDTVWEIFSFMKTHVSLNYLQVQPTKEEFKQLLNEIKEQSMYETGVNVGINDKILNLSTCSAAPGEDMYRYVLSAKLIEVNEIED